MHYLTYYIMKIKFFIIALSVIAFKISAYAEQTENAINFSDMAKMIDFYTNADDKEKALIDSLYVDYTNENKQQQIFSICDIPFGSPRSYALDVLLNKFGSAAITSTHPAITLEKVKYAGIKFDTVHFIFQTQGENSFLSGCMFVMRAKNRSQARLHIQKLYDAISGKYNLSSKTDKNKLSTYRGGISSLWNGNWFELYTDIFRTYHDAIKIETIDYGEELKEETGFRYGVSLIYGPFIYVEEKEEF